MMEEFVWHRAGSVVTRPCGSPCPRGWYDKVEVWVGRLVRDLDKPDEFYVDFRCPCGINKRSKVKA